MPKITNLNVIQPLDVITYLQERETEEHVKSSTSINSANSKLWETIEQLTGFCEPINSMNMLWGQL